MCLLQAGSPAHICLFHKCRAEPAALGESDKDIEAVGVVASAEQHPAEAAMVSGPAVAEAIALAKALPADMQPVSEEQQQAVVNPNAVLRSTAANPQTDTAPITPITVAQTESTQTSAVIADNNGVAAMHLAAAASSAAVTAVDKGEEVVTVAAKSEAVAAISVTGVTDGALGVPEPIPSTADAAERDCAAARSASNLQASGHEQGPPAVIDSISESSAGLETVQQAGASASQDQAGSGTDATYLFPVTQVSHSDSDMDGDAGNTNDAIRPVAQSSTLGSIHASLRRIGTSNGTS